MQESTSTPASCATPSWGATQGNTDGWGAQESMSTPASRAALGWGLGGGPTQGNVGRQDTLTPVSHAVLGWGPTQDNAYGWGVQEGTSIPVSHAPNSTTAPVPPPQPLLREHIAPDPSTITSHQLPSVPLSLAERIHSPGPVGGTTEPPPLSPPLSLAEQIAGPTPDETPQVAEPPDKNNLFNKLSANNNWAHRTCVASSEPDSKSCLKQTRASQNRLELHFRVWHENLNHYFDVPPIPPTLRNKSKVSQTVSSMYQEAYQWSQAMISEIEATRA
jgi:hypothetical protein